VDHGAEELVRIALRRHRLLGDALNERHVALVELWANLIDCFGCNFSKIVRARVIVHASGLEGADVEQRVDDRTKPLCRCLDRAQALTLQIGQRPKLFIEQQAQVADDRRHRCGELVTYVL
jgi:hypothetical protein